MKKIISNNLFMLTLVSTSLCFLSFNAWGAFQDTCFSPLEPCDQKLVTFVEGAKKSVDIAVYDINLPQVVDALTVLSKRIPVRIVVDKKQAFGKKSLVSKMIAAGIPLKFGVQKGSGIMHNKFAIVDGIGLETGSYNYTNHATNFNHENQFYTDEEVTVAKYNVYFSSLWANGAVPKSVSKILRAKYPR